MVHDFTLVYALNPELDSQDEILRRLAGNDCADAMVGWGRPGHVALAFSREALGHDAAVAACWLLHFVDGRFRQGHDLVELTSADRAAEGAR